MNNSKPYSKEFIQKKINVAKAGMGKMKVPVLYREQLSTGYSSLPIVGMGTKPLGNIRPQMFSVKSEDREVTKGTGNNKHLDDLPRIKKIEVNFNKNVKHLKSLQDK